MTTLGKITIVTMTALSAFALSAVLATGGKADNTASILINEKVAPFVNNASAVIYAPGLAQGSLFQLRGAVGSAWFTRKNDANKWCDVADLRLLSGDFGGDTIGVLRTEPVVLIAMNPSIATRLSQGQDIVSGNYSLLDVEQAVGHGLDGVDILVAGSGYAEGNYILNPGRSLLSDIFGASSTSNICEHNSAYAAITAE
jgi:hypothetical protein